MSTSKPRILILGAGVAGLSSAYHLLKTGEWDVTVLEKADRVGGLATSFQLSQAVFDFGPHAFHSQEPRLIDFFQSLMNGRFQEIQKDVAIQFQGQLYPYPLNPMKALSRMPPWVAVQCGTSYLWNLLTNHRSLDQIKTSEDFFVKNFGWKLYQLFFEGYTTKVWGIHPRELSADFIRNRLPSASLLRIAWSTFTGRDIRIRKPHEVPLKLRIFYPTQGSIQFPLALKEAIEKKGGRVLLNSPVTSIEMREGRFSAIRFADGALEKRLEGDILISTIPLTELVQSLEPAPSSEVLNASKQLRFRPILIVCLWIEKPRLFPQQTIYYTNRIFNRLAQMNSYSESITPSGTCGITAELTCREGDELWTMPERELIQRIVADMELEGLLVSSEVKESMVLRNKYGYPIYGLGFEGPLRLLRGTIQKIPNLYITGRQGMFNYAQMHFAASGGMQVADHVRQGKQKPAIPPTETEDVFFT